MAYPSSPGDTPTVACGPAGTGQTRPTSISNVPAVHDKPSCHGSPFMNEQAPASAPIILICERRRLRHHTQLGAWHSPRVLPGQPPSLTVTDPAGPAWDAWDEYRPYPRATCAFRASSCDICTGRTPRASGQPTLSVGSGFEPLAPHQAKRDLLIFVRGTTEWFHCGDDCRGGTCGRAPPATVAAPGAIRLPRLRS